MVEINLLPWRDYTQAHQKKIMKKILLATLLVTLIFLVSLHQVLSSRENALEARMHILQQQMQELQAQSIKQQQKTPQALPKRLFAITPLLDELIKMNADDVCFTDIIHHNKNTTFIGKTQTAAALTDYLKKWRAAFLFSHVKINQLEKKNNTIFDFRFEALGPSV